MDKPAFPDQELIQLAIILGLCRFIVEIGLGVLLLKQTKIADGFIDCIIPGHSMETFPDETKAIVETGCEIALHGYAHEGAYQMTAEQERDVLHKCIKLVEDLTGKKPVGYRAPLYLLKERTIALLQEHDFLWDSSLTHYDSTPYFLPKNLTPIEPIDFKADVKAESWRLCVGRDINCQLDLITPKELLHGNTSPLCY